MRRWVFTDFARHGAPILVEFGIGEPLYWCDSASMIGEVIRERVLTDTHALTEFSRNLVREIISTPHGARDPGALCIAVCRAAAARYLFEMSQISDTPGSTIIAPIGEKPAPLDVEGDPAP